ncbi:putative E3 ubiquitin-protein ligase FANCL [Helianthus annuus]|nr:putative E3 ubiquitin-protein ligase FANCL [Helianthus annuus]
MLFAIPSSRYIIYTMIVNSSFLHKLTPTDFVFGPFGVIDDELGPKSGSKTDYTCENTTCSKAFHSVCLGDWLRSITTTRQSFDVLFGNCPYCSQPVAVKIGARK